MTTTKTNKTTVYKSRGLQFCEFIGNAAITFSLEASTYNLSPVFKNLTCTCNKVLGQVARPSGITLTIQLEQATGKGVKGSK